MPPGIGYGPQGYVEALLARMRPPVFTTGMPAAPMPFGTAGMGGPIDPRGLLALGGPPTGLLDMAALPNANLNLRPATPQVPLPGPGAGGGGGEPPALSRALGAVGRAVQRLFGGRPDSRLSPEQNAAATREALMNAGLAMMLASGPAEIRPGFGQILAQGALAGQQAGAQARDGMVAAGMVRAREARLRAIMGGKGVPTIETMTDAMNELIAIGDIEAAKVLATGIQSLASLQGRQQAPELDSLDLGNEIVLYDPRTGDEIHRYKKSGKGQLERVDLIDRIAWFDSEGNEVRSAPKGAAPRAGGGGAAGGSLSERKAAAFLAFVPEAKAYLDSFEGAPGRVEQALTNKGLREFTDAEQQQLNLAGNTLAEAWLRMTTGAAYNQEELDNARALFTPQPGDKQETLGMKRRNRERLREMLRTSSGRLAPDASEMPDDPDAAAEWVRRGGR